MTKQKVCAVFLACSLAVAVSGCKKKVATVTNTPPPPAPTTTAPVAQRPSINSFEAEPSSVERGQSATLKWSVSNATEISISQGIGTVQASGTRSVNPTTTTTYLMTATGQGGSTTASVTVNVTQPAPPVTPTDNVKAPTKSLNERLATEVQDVYFEYDKYDIREDARATLQRNAEALKAILRDFPSNVITVEGHADERGSAEYNLGLGDRRCQAAREFLAQVGVPADRLKTVSYGKERPQCTEDTDACHSRNRRAHFSTGE